MFQTTLPSFRMQVMVSEPWVLMKPSSQRKDTELPSWRSYGLRAETVEFWQATADAGQIRLCYRRTGNDWNRELLWP